MFLRLVCAVTLVCVCVISTAAGPAAISPASPQESPIVIDDNLRVFTMVAALNVPGFDVELSSQYHPARAAVRKIAETLDPDLFWIGSSARATWAVFRNLGRNNMERMTVKLKNEKK